MNYRITITAYGQAELQDFLGLEAMTPGAQFTGVATALGRVLTFDVTGATFDRIRPQLIELSQRRLPAIDAKGSPLGTGTTMPLMTYTVTPVPGSRPRIHRLQVVGSSTHSVSLAGGAQTLQLLGNDLIPGLPAEYVLTATAPSLGRPVDILRFVAARKGPSGNRVTVATTAAAGAGAVTTRVGADGAVSVTIQPAAGADDVASVAAQLNSDTVASQYVGAVPIDGAAKVSPRSGLRLAGGDGTGVAFADLLVGTGPSHLLLEARKAGNPGNAITVTLLASQGADAVAVSGNDVTVSRTAATTAIATLASAINADAAASALVRATAVGSGSLGAVPKTWLAGGSGEGLTITVAGVAVDVVTHTDSQITATVVGTALAAAGAVAGQAGVVQLLMNQDAVQAQLHLVA